MTVTLRIVLHPISSAPCVWISCRARGERFYMGDLEEGLTRREVLIRGGWFTLGAAITALPATCLAEELAVLDVAYAGSMGSLMEGPLKASVAQNLKLEMHGRAQGSSALAQLIVAGNIRPDIFIPITPGPMMTVLRAGKAESALPVAHTEMVIAYSPRSRLVPNFEAAAKD